MLVQSWHSATDMSVIVTIKMLLRVTSLKLKYFLGDGSGVREPHNRG